MLFCKYSIVSLWWLSDKALLNVCKITFSEMRKPKATSNLTYIPRYHVKSVPARVQDIFIARSPCLIRTSRNRLFFSLCFDQNERDKVPNYCMYDNDGRQARIFHPVCNQPWPTEDARADQTPLSPPPPQRPRPPPAGLPGGPVHLRGRPVHPRDVELRRGHRLSRRQRRGTRHLRAVRRCQLPLL